MKLRRRAMLLGLLASGVAPRVSVAAPTARVVVIGGGFAGATCARTLRALAPGADIVLIEPRPAFYTGPFTNAAVASLCTEGDILRSPAALAAANIRWLRERVVALDPVTRRVRTDRGTELAADRIVVAPGVAMRWDRIAGLDATTTDAMPHAWLGDAQVPRLRERIEALRDGATLAIAAPPNPYRCPPGPYERAALLAWRFGQTARRRIKILILDAKDDFTKHALFVSGWDALYPGVIEWVPRAKGGEVVRVDPRRGTLHLAGGSTVRATLASVVPPQQAAQLAHDADLADETRWCPIDPVTFESTRHAGIHVIGDAAAGAPMPKSAFSANSQAKQAALAIAAALSHTPPPDVRLVNTCYSLLAPDYGISVGGLYGAAAGRLSALSEGMSPAGAPQEVRAREAGYARDWYRRITRDAFG